MYVRQKDLGISVPPEISVIGCGGVGAWVAIDLAMIGVERINLFDDDNLELHNINRIPFGPGDVGKPKREVLKKFIKKIRPSTRIYMHNKLTEITKQLLDGHIIDCTDKLASQQLIYKECKRQNLPYYRVGYDGHHLSVFDGSHSDAPKIDKVWDDESGRDGYTIINSWVVPPQIAAAIVTNMICHRRGSRPIDVNIDTLMNINAYMER